MISTPKTTTSIVFIFILIIFLGVFIILCLTTLFCLVCDCCGLSEKFGYVGGHDECEEDFIDTSFPINIENIRRIDYFLTQNEFLETEHSISSEEDRV